MNMQAIGQTIAAPRPPRSPAELGMPRSKGIVLGFWIVTALLCGRLGSPAAPERVGAVPRVDRMTI